MGHRISGVGHDTGLRLGTHPLATVAQGQSGTPSTGQQPVASRDFCGMYCAQVEASAN